MAPITLKGTEAHKCANTRRKGKAKKKVLERTLSLRSYFHHQGSNYSTLVGFCGTEFQTMKVNYICLFLFSSTTMQPSTGIWMILF